MSGRTRWIEKIQDFRLLPVFVLISMGLGILFGKWYGISNFELTPPIDAIKSIFRGTYQFTIPNTLALGVVIGLFLMMYPAMTNVKLEDLGKAFKSPKQDLIIKQPGIILQMAVPMTIFFWAMFGIVYRICISKLMHSKVMGVQQLAVAILFNRQGF